MANENFYSDDDRQYLQMMQDNISRMANNSANCKTWVVTLVAGLFAIGAGIDQLNGWLALTIVPILAFWYLDTFYLHLERGMRNRQKDFLNKAKANYAITDDLEVEVRKSIQNAYLEALYVFAPMPIKKSDLSKGFVSTVDRFFSKSTAPFYGTLLACVMLVLILANCECIEHILKCLKDACGSRT